MTIAELILELAKLPDSDRDVFLSSSDSGSYHKIVTFNSRVDLNTDKEYLVIRGD